MAISLIPHGRGQQTQEGINISRIMQKYKYLSPVLVVFVFFVFLYAGSELWIKSLEKRIVDLQGKKDVLLELAENTQKTLNDAKINISTLVDTISTLKS